MKNWINSPLKLTGGKVELISLDDTHIGELEMIAKDKRIWTFYPVDGSDPEKLVPSLKSSIDERERGIQFPFVIYDRKKKRIIGSTRYLDIQPAHKKLEIGWTWISPEYWGTSINTECKLLLLTHCFES
jgi:RimJ/RimL family protein N-acetyltransferase